MSSKKHKTSFKKKKSTTDYYGDDGSEPQYTEEQKRRISSYLKENDENCKESTTLILIIVIGLLIALSIVGFLAIRNHPSIKYKGAHTTYEHSSNSSILDMVWNKWTWLQNLYLGVNDNSTNSTTDAIEIQAIVALEEELNDFQPIYRNPLLQQLYKPTDIDEECNVLSDDSIYNFIAIKHGSWVPSPQYLTEAVDFSWADFQTQQEKEEIELVDSVNKDDLTDADKQKKKALQKQIREDRKKRRQQNKKNKQTEGQTTRRLLGGIHMGLNGMHRFDPLHALPNPANIINPHSKGDEGAGDIEAEARKHMSDPKKFRGGKLPNWLQNAHGLPRPPRDFAKDLRDKMPFGTQKHLKHLDDIRKMNFGKGVLKSPKDILKQLDLSRFGIKNPVTEQTSDAEKEKDLHTLQQKEAKRHPYMTLLTNPGPMEDVKCVNNDYRTHQVVLKKLDKSEAVNTVTNGVDVDGKKSVFSYDNNVLMWYCYLVTLQADAINVNELEGAFKVNLTLYDVNMEIGFDYVQVYINSQLIDTVSGIGLNWEENESTPSFVYYMDGDYVERNGDSMEVCMKIVTDSNIVKDGFSSTFTVHYDDPLITKWSDWSECTTLKASHYKGHKNDKHWNGDCGVGVRTKSVTDCTDPTTLDPPLNGRATCNMGESLTEYCVKANCYDFPMTIVPQHPNQAFLFNGHGRIDPDFADPFRVQRSTQQSFNITNIITELGAVRDQIIERYPDEKVLGSAVINHYYMDQSKLRLGIRLARSLLLGDTFTVYMTGSSNTAGHENMFLSTWPMQLQSIMRPIWKRIGYKGAAFVVKDHAEGGGLGTMQLGPCIPSLIGDDADVVYWESQMNDHGDSTAHSEENHFRNVITLPRRPMYHVMHAGKQGPSHPGNYDVQYAASNGKTAQYKNEGNCYNWVCGKGNEDSSNPDYPGGLLMEPYTDYGSGLVQFYPTNGLAGVNKTKYEEFKTENLYISWHPGPPGHRVYAEMLAYHYLTSVLETFTDIRDLIEDLTPKEQSTTAPIEEMLEILEDPPRKKSLPHDSVAGQCDPLCTNATEAVCIAGYKTLGKPRYSLKRWRQKKSGNEDSGQWEWNNWMGNYEAFSLKTGGAGSNDIKSQWQSKSKDTNELRFVFEAKQYGFVAIECDGINERVNEKKEVEIKIFEVDLESGELNAESPTYKENGETLQCLEYKKGDRDWQTGSNGCNIGGLQAYQKYLLVINANVPSVGIKNIRVF